MGSLLIMMILLLIILVILKTFLARIRFFNHHLSWMITIVILAFLVIGFMIAISGQGLDLTSGEGIKTAFKLYAAWFGNSLTNMESITSNAIKLDWSANNTLEG